MPKQSDGTGTTIQIPHDLISGQIGVLQGRTIELGRLFRIDLIERLGRNAIANVTNSIGDITVSKEMTDLFAQNHVSALCIDIVRDGGHASYCLQTLHQFFTVGQFLTVDDQTDHQLTNISDL